MSTTVTYQDMLEEHIEQPVKFTTPLNNSQETASKSAFQEYSQETDSGPVFRGVENIPMKNIPSFPSKVYDGENVTATGLESNRTGNNYRAGHDPEFGDENDSFGNEQSTSEEEYEDIEYPEGGAEAWKVVLGSFLGMLCVLGIINSMGAIQAYISVNQLAQKSDLEISLIFSIFVFFCYIFSGQVGPFFDSFGPYHLSIIGAFFFTLGIMMTSLSNAYYQFFLSFSTCCGLGCALLMTPQVAILGHWFNVKRGTAIGSATVGGSLGGVVFPIMLRKLYTSVGYAWAIRILGFICLGCLAASAYLMKPRLKKTQRPKFKLVWSNVLDIKSLKDMRFSWLIVANFLGELAVVNGVTYLTSYAIAQGVDETTAYVLLTVLNSTGMVGRWLSGYLADKWGRFNVLIVTVIMAFTTIFVIWLPFKSVPSMITFSVLHGLCNGGILAGTPSCVGQICRTQDYGKRYGTLYFFTSFAILGGLPISAALIRGNDYSGLIIFTGALYVATMFALLFSRYCAVGFRLCKW